MTFSDYHYLSGEYCPDAENGSAQGQVFLKLGRTEEESFWLVSNDGSSDCDKAWVLRKLDPQDDFSKPSDQYAAWLMLASGGV